MDVAVRLGDYDWVIRKNSEIEGAQHQKIKTDELGINGPIS